MTTQPRTKTLREQNRARRGMEEALRQSEEMFRVLSAESPSGVFRSDATGLTYANDRFLEICGLSLKEALGRGYLNAVHPDDLPVALAARRNPRKPVDLEHRILVRGEVRWVRVRSKPLFSATRRFLCRIGTVNDVTDRRRAEDAQRQESAEQFQSLFMEAPVASAMVSKEGRFLRVNPAFCAFLGYTEKELLRKTVLDITHPDDAVSSAELIARLESKPLSIKRHEKRYLHRSGKVLWGEVSVSAIAGAHGGRAYAIAQVLDITERKRAEEELRRAHEELEQRVRERTKQLRALAEKLTRAEQEERQRIVHILHEDLQQLLAGARFTLRTIPRSPSEARRRKAIETVDRVLDRASELTRSLSQGLRPPVLYAGGLLPALQWLAGQMKSDYGFVARIQGIADDGGEDESRRDFLYQSVRELLFNVRKHSGVNRASVRLTRADGDRVRVVVKDSGSGFDAARISPNSLGLFSIRERVAFLGGHMEVITAPGRGTTVTFTV